MFVIPLDFDGIVGQVRTDRPVVWVKILNGDIVQVTALFNYYNRLAEGLGIDPEPPASAPPARPDP